MDIRQVQLVMSFEWLVVYYCNCWNLWKCSWSDDFSSLHYVKLMLQWWESGHILDTGVSVMISSLTA